MVPWLANKLAEWEVSLSPGQYIPAGALATSMAGSAGETLTASFAKVGLVSARFVCPRLMTASGH